MIHAELIRKAKVIKNLRGGSIADVITTYGGPGIDAEYRKVIEEMHAELGDPGA